MSSFTPQRTQNISGGTNPPQEDNAQQGATSHNNPSTRYSGQLNAELVPPVYSVDSQPSIYKSDSLTSFSFDFNHLSPEVTADSSFHAAELSDLLWRVEDENDSNPQTYHDGMLHNSSADHIMNISPAQENLMPVAATQGPQTQTPAGMPLLPRPAIVIPTLEGFKVHILELYPRLAPYLVDRIAHEQVRRYKRLVKNRVDHEISCVEANCQSGALCFAAGGEAEILPVRPDNQDTASISARFKSTSGADSDNEDSALLHLVPAVFPDWIPLPPTKKFPARFECPICFQAKSVQKPSDWTEHVHEDVQPYTCTFASCQEPKSFKRWVDWVRHENARHRCLDWWECNQSECTHICYRKDNFVQHLVREHKHKEPKTKPRLEPPGGGKAKFGQVLTQEELEFWNLVDSCRHESGADAKNEPCKFCGDVLASWKQLSVHVAKHMEQIAMPVLGLAQKRNVTKDTIISPIEPLQSSSSAFLGVEQTVMESNALSPLPQSGPSYTDSGYASWRPPEDKPFLVHEISNQQHLSGLDQFDALETRTVYSDGASIDTTKRDDFVGRFAEVLLKDVAQHQLDDIVEVTFSDGIDELLADFATRLGQSDSSPELRQAMVFIHKYRSSISRTLQQITHPVSDEDSDEGHSVPDKPPVHEIMQMWFDRGQDVDGQIPVIEEPEDIELQPEELSDPLENDAQNYERLIAATLAYQWLIASLRNKSLLTAASDNVVGHIRAEVCKHVVKSVHLSKLAPTILTEAHFEMDWDFEIFDDVKDGRVMDSILTVTGSEQEAQAMTCAQYIQQTWPTNGMFLWQLLKDALRNPDETMVMAKKGMDTTYMSARCCDSRLTVTMIDLRGAVVEAAEQLCWMSSALNSAFSTSEDGILLCIPSIRWTGRSPPNPNDGPSSDSYRMYSSSSDTHRFPFHHISPAPTSDPTMRVSEENSNVKQRPSPSFTFIAPPKQKSSEPKKAEAIVHFEITLEYKKCDASSHAGTCWQYLFKRCVIVQGFPIRRRSRPELGLELSLELMVKLMGTKYLYQFSEHLFFKQFSMMLAPSSQVDELLIWHLCKSRNGDRISYLDHGMTDLCKIGYDGLLKARHIVGWCSNIKHFAGHAAADYNVESSILEASPPSGSLFNCQLSFGRPVSGERDVHFSANHQRVSLSQRNYLDMFRFLERRFILLWDTDSSRGWLVNGLRASLHLLRQSLKIDEKEDSGGLFVLKPEDLLEPKHPCSARAARKFLDNPKNLSAKVSISAIRGTVFEYETLSERFERIYDVVEQAFDYQSKRRNWDQLSRSNLEGWDFLSVARKDDTIPPSALTLPSIGKSWVDFIRAISAVTLIGDGFGEMLQPGTPTCDSMPRDRFCLAVSVSDLSQIIGVNRHKMGTKPRLICRSPLIVWYSPLGSSSQCGCDNTEESRVTQRCVQVMWPAGQAAVLPAEGDNFTLEGYLNGALIFGHDDSLQYYLPDFGQIPLPGPPPEANKELEMIDSGIGSSLDSMAGLEKLPTRSTLSPFDDPQSISGHSNSQGNLYGNSFMSGGYGVYGNVTGNFSVNQYFRLMPSHDTSLSSLQPPQAVPQKLGSTSQQTGGTDSRWSLPQDQIPMPNPEQEEQGSIDVEMLRGQMEVRALGLEDYCSIFRC